MFGGADLPSDFNFIKIFIVIFMVIFCIGFIVLFGWLFKKLSSDVIKEEFIIPETIIPVN
jgi:flagellar biogenesis protein FliO